MSKPIRKAVFPVGGLGTRFLPATKAMPKEMLPIVDKPLIQYAVEEAIASGIEEFIFVTGRGKSAIEDHFDYSLELKLSLENKEIDANSPEYHQKLLSPGSIIYTRQQEPLGLGHAVWCARYALDGEPFAVLLADEFMFGSKPCLKGMIDLYYQFEYSNIIVVDQVNADQVSRYGIIEPAANNTSSTIKIKSIVEKPYSELAPSNLAIVGRYILNYEIISLLESQPPGANGEIQITDSLQQLIQTQSLYGYQYSGTRYDCGSKAGYVAATLHIALERPDIEAELGDYLLKMGFSSKSLTMVEA